MCILVILYIRMGLILRETNSGGIQRNLPRTPRPSITHQQICAVSNNRLVFDDFLKLS